MVLLVLNPTRKEQHLAWIIILTENLLNRKQRLTIYPIDFHRH